VSKELAVLATVAIGGVAAVQAPVNNVLSKKVGTFGAVSINFLAGAAIVVIVLFAFEGGFKSVADEPTPAWYYWVIGALSGVAIVLTTLLTVRELGAGGVTGAMIAGQLTLAVIIDRLGVFGLEERAVTAQKLLGIALLAIGTILIVRE
jgi:transporter family-2 protein